jgi:hypothetical protein
MVGVIGADAVKANISTVKSILDIGEVPTQCIDALACNPLLVSAYRTVERLDERHPTHKQ